MSTATGQQPDLAESFVHRAMTADREQLKALFAEALRQADALRAVILPMLAEIKDMRDGLPQDCAADLQVIAGWDAVIGPVEKALKA